MRFNDYFINHIGFYFLWLYFVESISARRILSFEIYCVLQVEDIKNISDKYLNQLYKNISHQRVKKVELIQNTELSVTVLSWVEVHLITSILHNLHESSMYILPASEKSQCGPLHVLYILYVIINK